MTAKPSAFDPQVIATTCMSVVEATLSKMSSITFSQPPTFAEKKIVDYNNKMRVFGMEIFNGPCYVSFVSYYFSPKHLEDHQACGAFVLYVEEKSAERLFKMLGYTMANEDDESTMLDSCGEFCNVLGGNFKNEIAQLGYLDLTISAPRNYHNSVPEGVEFNYSQYIKYETSFYLWRSKTLAVDITLSSIPEKR